METTTKETCTKNDSVVSDTGECVAVAGTSGYLICKRFADLVFALAAGVIFLIPMLIIGVLVKLDSKGPAIFKQERLGQDGRPFVIYKFRSMVENAEADGPKWAEVNDNRCTRLGRILRKSRLDELPQLINIIKGDMSFIGPRPLLVKYLPLYSEHQRKRHLVRPGLSGLAQVSGRNVLNWQDRLNLDVEYVHNISLALDIKVFFMTISAVLKREGISSETSATMEAFTGNPKEAETVEI